MGGLRRAHHPHRLMGKWETDPLEQTEQTSGVHRHGVGWAEHPLLLLLASGCPLRSKHPMTESPGCRTRFLSAKGRGQILCHCGVGGGGLGQGSTQA